MYEIYQIEYGDTIDSIAQKTGTTVEKLQEINKSVTVVPGAYIIVPTTNNDLFTMYTVKSGDNPYAISKKYGISVDNLMMLNGLNKNDYLYPGQKLVVPRENIDIYITKQGDTLSTLTNNFKTGYDNLLKQNEKIYLSPDQLIIFRAEK